MANINISTLKRDDQEFKPVSNLDMKAIVGGQQIVFQGIEFIYANGKVVGYYDHDEGTCNPL